MCFEKRKRGSGWNQAKQKEEKDGRFWDLRGRFWPEMEEFPAVSQSNMKLSDSVESSENLVNVMDYYLLDEVESRV
nr:hypothetical protein Iba_chr14bCG9580 [Ipomoea batatas]GMD88419.1 hypothetical protein Iba_chr14cCG6850 [Ipomoea batatas]GME15085.1 hypothetical protein Iba_scaffold15863CG0050 [Ipomoea batatas]